MKIQLHALAILSLVAILPVASKAVTLVQNGGFETGDFTDWTLTGNTGFTSVDTNAHSGNFAGDFGAVGSDTFLDQNIATTIGDTYEISFWLANDGGSPNDFSASFGGTTGLSLNDAGGFEYTEYSYSAVATSTSTDLDFTVRQDPAYFHLDDISVTDAGVGVPDSGPTLLLVAATLAGLCAFGYRSRKNLPAV